MLNSPLMNALWLALGVVIGAALMAVALRPRLRALTVEAARSRELENRLVKTSTELEQERARAVEQLATINDAQERLSASFKAMSADALQSSMTQLTELARAQLQTAQTEAKGDLEKRQQAVEQLVAPLKEQLGRVDSQLLRLDQERRESRGQMSAQLRTLAETSDRLRTETSALVTALRKPNARGQWGQMQLRNVVEAAGMLKHCDFVEQHSYAGDETTLRPDMVVNLPGGKHVVVDAKSPLQGMLDAHEARDAAERDEFLRGHARLLRKHVKALADKAYWSRLDTTPDMVVMFLPGRVAARPGAGGRPDADAGRHDPARAHRHPDDPAGAAALGRLRVAAGARRRVRPGDLRARARAPRPLGQALDPPRQPRHAAQPHGQRVQRDDRLLRVAGAAERPALR